MNSTFGEAIWSTGGLEKFFALKQLELYGNNLTKNSNLAFLAGLPLEHLDLSTNKL